MVEVVVDRQGECNALPVVGKLAKIEELRGGEERRERESEQYVDEDGLKWPGESGREGVREARRGGRGTDVLVTP